MRFRVPAAAVLAALPLPALTQTQTQADTPSTIIVLDGSGSMWGQIDGRPKLEIAREVLGRVLAEVPADRALGMLAYGHRRRGDCADIELVVPPAPGTAGAITQAANTMRFQGRTPLSEAVRQAARELNFTENPATVVLITDGIETCQADPCALARELEAAGVGFTAHVVGFGMTAEEGAQVACLAQETGGQYLLADDAGDLLAALSATVAAVPGAGAAPAAAAPAPAPVADDPLPPATLQAPTEVMALERFAVAVTGPLNPGDYLDVVYDGQTRVGDYLFWVMLSEGVPATLTAPVEPGDYQIRYVEDRDESGPRVLATWPLSVAPAEYGLQAADSAIGGTLLRVEWQGPAGASDWIDIAPAGSDDTGAYLPGWVGSLTAGMPVELTVPTAPGAYALRYVAVGPEGARVMISRPLTGTAPEATLTAPDRVEAGAAYRIGWTGPFHPQHYITLTAPAAGDEDFAHGYFNLAAPGLPGELTAPEAPGLYELRFVLFTEGPQVLARRPLEVVPAGSLGAAKE
jgi:Ca-activated chloride channel family protein